MQLKRFPTSSGELLFGQIPSVAELKTLKKQKIDCIWNLAQELSVLVPYEKLYTNEVLFGNISDFGVPRGDAFLGQLNRVVELLKKGKKVFVHCFGGHGRTGTALAAIDVALNGKSSGEALENAYAYARGPETPAQDEYIELLDTLYNGAPKKPKKKKQDVFKRDESDYAKLWEELTNRRDSKPYGKEIDLSKWPDEDEDIKPKNPTPRSAFRPEIEFPKPKSQTQKENEAARTKYLENLPFAVPVDDAAQKRREERFDAIQKSRKERGLPPLPERFRKGPKK